MGCNFCNHAGMTDAHPIAAYRAKKGLTVGQLAEQLAVDRTTVWRWENGRSQVPMRLLSRVEGETGISRHVLRPDVFGRAA